MLKVFLNYRYKTLHEIHPETFGHDDIRLFFKSAYFQIILELDEIELIYINEFFWLKSNYTKDGLKIGRIDIWRR